MIDNSIKPKEYPQTEKINRRTILRRLGIYAICYDWANNKKYLGEYMANKRTHKSFLRKHKLGKFSKKL